MSLGGGKSRARRVPEPNIYFLPRLMLSLHKITTTSSNMARSRVIHTYEIIQLRHWNIMFGKCKRMQDIALACEKKLSIKKQNLNMLVKLKIYKKRFSTLNHSLSKSGQVIYIWVNINSLHFAQSQCSHRHSSRTSCL